MRDRSDGISYQTFDPSLGVSTKTHKSFPRKYRAISLFQRAASPAPSSAMYLNLSFDFNESSRSSILWIHSTRSLTRSSSYCSHAPIGSVYPSGLGGRRRARRATHLLVDGKVDIGDTFLQDGGQSDRHGSMGERVFLQDPERFEMPKFSFVR